MEALSVERIPEGPEWQYEPKWDGFRCLAFRDGRKVELQSKSEQPLARYFPEIREAVGKVDSDCFVLDGEIAVPRDRAFSFDALLQRIHPAASRVSRLSKETPAILIVFDLLAGSNGKSLLDTPLRNRRIHLEEFARAHLSAQKGIRLSPFTTDIQEARAWLAETGTMLDGIIAKKREFLYTSGERTGMQKIKNYRSADCVVGGFRYAKGKKTVGSLLLGLYDDQGLLHHVGFSSAIARSELKALTKKLEALVEPPGFTGRSPGGPSRWSRGKSNEWQPIKAHLVVEVCYDHANAERFRHGTRILRWRPDKDPHQCTIDQLEQKGANLLELLQ
jgi:ATP-dependent DNA ligase